MDRLFTVGIAEDQVSMIATAAADFQRISLPGIDGLLDADHGSKSGVFLIDIACWDPDRYAHLKALPGERYYLLCAPKSRTKDVVAALGQGVDDYLIYPLMPSELKLKLSRAGKANRKMAELEYLRDQFWREDAKRYLQTENPVMSKLFKNLKSVAPTRSTVLLTGETGVGKSRFAKLIHQHGKQSNGPFIAVHCGAIPESLIESELFGHEKGAFTGAVKRKLGKFELAHGGTIFLDEIATITQATQVKLLQVLQEGFITRVGGEKEVRIDIRVISATNEDLKELVDRGQFRKDLFYRLNVFPLEIPPLRRRREDVPALAEQLLAEAMGRPEVHLGEQVAAALSAYHWPGNIRELENVLERAAILAAGETVSLEHLPPEISGLPPADIAEFYDISKPLAEARKDTIDRYERGYLHALLTEKRGKINETAAAAGLGVRQLHKLMAKHGLIKEAYKSD